MKWFSKRAVSPLIATIILIAISVAGGLLVYTVFFSTAGTISAKGQLTVEAIDMVKDTGGNIAFSITIKNTGNKPIANPATGHPLNITLATDSHNPLNLDAGKNLQPGQSTSTVLYSTTQIDNTYVVGNSYNVVIHVVFSDGSTFTTTTSVKCRSG
jgi:flagellin-like protein